ncbi:hypothetical protein CHS0354_024279 [Potamilus streckersoni]|uniref:Hexosyltransferase n=1 Tax=Potamilus streckersoni TaxID=2493646 RepID=A0AAE0VRX8_9BIVA|nr:hypothetical protein CHS0354_024279 [Potamilus streckersoni]
MNKLRPFFFALCVVVILFILMYANFVTINTYQGLAEKSVCEMNITEFGITHSVPTSATLLNDIRIKLTKINHNGSTTGTVMTKSRIKTIQQLYGKSWNSIITPYPTQFLIDGRDICNVSPPPFLLIFVLSLPKNTEERQAIRKTWGSVVKEHKKSFNFSARMMFILGQMEDKITQHKALQKESENHKDIVQIDLIESRYNLTRKMMSGLKWIKTYCNSVTYILKCDDDTFINAARFSEYLLKNPNINNVTIHGWVYTRGLVRREGKYKVKVEEYPKSVFPHLTSGTAYILPFDVITNMLDMAERLPYCPVDDAFMTGVLRTILDLKVQHSADFTHMDEKKINPCRFYSKLSVTNISPKCMYILWNLTTQAQRINCNQRKLFNKNVCPIFR